MENPILDTILTSEVLGTTQSNPNYELFTKSSDEAETQYPEVFEGGKSDSGSHFDLGGARNHSAQPKL